MHRVPILLVEDDPNDVLFFKRALEKADIFNPLHVAQGGQDAIDYLAGAGEFADRTKFPPPGLVILDLNLPQRTGFDVLHWIRYHPELTKTLVAVLTSSNQHADRQEAYRLGAGSYLVKPTDPDQLVEIIKELMTRWKQLCR